MLSSLSTSSIISRHLLSDKSVSANGNPKANVAVVYKGLGGEQRTGVCEGGSSSEQALRGRVRIGRRDALEENHGLVIEVQASVLLETRPMSESTSSATESLALRRTTKVFFFSI